MATTALGSAALGLKTAWRSQALRALEADQVVVTKFLERFVSFLLYNIKNDL